MTTSLLSDKRQKKLAKALANFEWAVRMLNESTTPEVVDVKRLLHEIEREVMAAQKARAGANHGG